MMSIGQFRPTGGMMLRPMTRRQAALLADIVAGTKVFYMIDGNHYAYVRIDTYENVSATIKGLMRRGMVESVHSQGYTSSSNPVKREEVRASSMGEAYAATLPPVGAKPC